MSRQEARNAFTLLTDETRVEIVRGLVQSFIESPLDRGVSFTTLFEQTDISDSGLFNYHLNELLGDLVVKTQTGYRLTIAGVHVAGSVFGVMDFSFSEPFERELGRDCPLCAGPVTLAYQQGLLSVGCGSGHEFEDVAPPRLVRDHGPETVADVLACKIAGNVRQAQRGVCAQCFGSVDWQMYEVTGELRTKFDAPVVVLGQCQTCAVPHVADPGGFAVVAPGMEHRLRTCGVDIWEDPAGWLLRTHDRRLESYDLEAGTATSIVDVDERSFRIRTDKRGRVLE